MNQELMNVFGTAKEIPTFDRIKISLASPDQILRWSMARSKSPRPSTTAPSSRSATACSAPASSGR